MPSIVSDYASIISQFSLTKPKLVSKFTGLLKSFRHGKPHRRRGKTCILYASGTDFSDVFELPNEEPFHTVQKVFWTCICRSLKIDWVDFIDLKENNPVDMDAIRERPDIDVTFYTNDQGEVGEYWNGRHISGPQIPYIPEPEGELYLWNYDVMKAEYVPDDNVLDAMHEYLEQIGVDTPESYDLEYYGM